MTIKRKTSLPEKQLAEKTPPLENIEFGKRIKRERQNRELTLDEFSRLTKLVDPNGEGISRVSLSRYENGTYAPGLRELKILAQSLKCTLSRLVYNRDDDPMNFIKPGLENVMMDLVYDVLVGQGLIKGNDEEDCIMTESYEALLRKAREPL